MGGALRAVWRSRLGVCCLLLASAGGCGDDDTPPQADAGVDAALDAAAPDAATGGCLQVRASSFQLEVFDDVSVQYESVVEPTVPGTDRGVGLLFERYTPGPDIGSFPLGEGPDGNFGTCAHCVFIAVERTRGFFADRGTLVTRADPYVRHLSVQVTNLRLVEVEIDGTTRESTPVPDGACVEVEDFEVDAVFPPEEWTCRERDWADGEACQCECGAFDPDCQSMSQCPADDPLCDLEPVTLPVVDCEEEEICGFDPVGFTSHCVEVCDWEGRDGCAEGVCVFDFGAEQADVCFTQESRIDAATHGEPCGGGPLQKVCHVVDGFAEGFCDENQICQPLCTSDEECVGDGEECRRFYFEGELGFCGLPFSPED